MTRNYNYLMLHFVYCLCVCTVLSCSSYRFAKDDNPFADYRVKSVAIPMFVNKSVIPNVHASLTREITLLLSGYDGLEVFPGESSRADAILVGVVKSNRTLQSVFNEDGRKFISDEGVIGGRKQFYVPKKTNYSLSLQLVLIRNSSPLDLKLARSKWGESLKGNPRIIFNEHIALESGFSRVISEDMGVDGGGPVNFTKTKGVFVNSLNSLSKNAAQKFKQVVLNAF